MQAEILLAALGEKTCIVRFSGIYRESLFRLIEQLKQGRANKIKQDYFTHRIPVVDCYTYLTFRYLVNSYS